MSSQIWEEGSSWRWGTHYQGLGFLHFQINELGIGEVNLIRMEPRLIFFSFQCFHDLGIENQPWREAALSVKTVE